MKGFGKLSFVHSFENFFWHVTAYPSGLGHPTKDEIYLVINLINTASMSQMIKLKQFSYKVYGLSQRKPIHGLCEYSGTSRAQSS